MLYKRFKKHVGSFCCFVERWLSVFGVVNKCDFFFCEEKKVEYFMLIYCLGIIFSCTSTHQLVEKEFNVRQMLYYDLFFYECIQTVMSKLWKRISVQVLNPAPSSLPSTMCTAFLWCLGARVKTSCSNKREWIWCYQHLI